MNNRVVHRNSSVELLRIVLMFFILFWHILVHGGGISSIGTSAYTAHSTTLAELLSCCILCVAVDCFIFISGYYGIKFKWRSLISFVLMGLFWSLTTFGMAALYDKGTITNENLYRALCPITGKLWWFFTYYMALYVISPLLKKNG